VDEDIYQPVRKRGVCRDGDIYVQSGDVSVPYQYLAAQESSRVVIKSRSIRGNTRH